ncbi:Nif3-like dinuclear metal center hexameric protein [Clostridium sp. DL1XJH146]
MSLKIKDLDNIMQEFAPNIYKEDYDNVGLMVGDNGQQINNILIALDCTMNVIDEAIAKSCNTIVTHHPLLFVKPQNITMNSVKGSKIIKLIKNNINLYSSHTNLDSTHNGLNDLLMSILGLENTQIMEYSKVKLAHEKKVGIGRVAVLDTPIIFEKLILKVKEDLEINTLRYTGDENKEINKIAVINGSGQDYFQLAKDMGADCIITGDTTYHFVSDFMEEGMCIIDAGHFSTEWTAMQLFAGKLKNRINEKGFNNSVLISENSVDPYKYK